MTNEGIRSKGKQNFWNPNEGSVQFELLRLLCLLRACLPLQRAKFQPQNHSLFEELCPLKICREKKVGISVPSQR